MAPHKAETADSGSRIRPNPSMGFDFCILFNPAGLLGTVYDRNKMDSDRYVHAQIQYFASN
jgi:hypothetical protein